MGEGYVSTIMQGREQRSGEVSKIEVIIKEESAGKNPHANGGMEQIIEQITSVTAESLPPKSPWSSCHLHGFQQTTQHFQLPPVSSEAALLRRRLCLTSAACGWLGTPSRISMLALVAASKTSSTPSILRAEHSL